MFFEHLNISRYVPVAHLEEHLPPKEKVEGSNPFRNIMALGEAWCDPPACHAGEAGSIPARVVKAWLVSIPAGPAVGRF